MSNVQNPSSSFLNAASEDVLQEYEEYAKYVTAAYAKLRERREKGIRDTDVLESPMYKRYYGSTNTENKVSVQPQTEAKG